MDGRSGDPSHGRTLFNEQTANENLSDGEEFLDAGEAGVERRLDVTRHSPSALVHVWRELDRDCPAYCYFHCCSSMVASLKHIVSREGALMMGQSQMKWKNRVAVPLGVAGLLGVILVGMAAEWGPTYVIQGLKGFWPSSAGITAGLVIVLAAALVNVRRQETHSKRTTWALYAAGFVIGALGELALYYTLVGCCYV